MVDDDQRSPMSIGISLAARGSLLGIEFGVPVFLGHFIDLKLKSNPVGLLSGMVLGFVIGMMHLLRFAKDSNRPR